MNEALSLYLSGQKKTSVLMIGNRGLNMLDEARMAASSILSVNIEKLDYHPDYLFVDTNGEKSIGVEQVTLIQQKASLMPCQSDKVVIVVDQMNTMTEQAQNKLLKLIEESSYVLLIMICYSDNVLSTIKSRCRIVYYNPLTMAQFEGYCNHTADSKNLYYITGGCPGLINEYPTALPIFTKVATAIKERKYTQLLSVLNLVKEKDKDNFYLVFPELTSNLFFLIGELAKEDNRGDIFICVADIVSNYERAIYTKDTFFFDVLRIIETANRQERS